MTYTFSNIIRDERVAKAAYFLCTNPEASLEELAWHMRVGETMCATLYREAALRFLAAHGYDDTVRRVKDAMRAKAPPCTR